jgi:hypothetical protein
MRAAAGFLGIVAALGAAYFVYDAQLTRPGAAGAAPPQQQIDVSGVRASLLQIGQAQRIYLVAHGAYGTLDQLRADGAPHLGGDQRGYVFDVQPNGAQGFTATAAPADSARAGWPTLTLDETLQVTTR